MMLLVIMLCCLSARPVLSSEVTDAKQMREKLREAFEPVPATPKLVALALQPASDNLSRNIKQRAYWYLNWRQPNASDLALLKENLGKFVADWKALDDRKEQFVRSEAGKLILKLGAPSDIKADITLDILSDSHLGFAYSAPSAEKKYEDEAIRLIQSLAGQPSAADHIVTALSAKIPKQFNLSARVIEACLSLIDGLVARISDETMQSLVRARFELVDDIEAQRSRREVTRMPHRGHSVTIWDGATDSEVDAMLKHFERTACARPFRPSLKSWKYYLVKNGRGFEDKVEELTCAAR